MRRTAYRIALAGILTSGLGAASVAKGEAPGFAVVELFTSEGCSSCPPADELLRQIDEVASETEVPVLALSMHVDYWNQLGWTDPFSSAAMTRRQRAYAAAAGERRVYTPQMIVNGEERFVGSNAREATRAINAALGGESPQSLAVTARPAGGGFDVTYQASGDLDGMVVNVALVQPEATIKARRGENAGRTLSHINVVRALRTVSADQSGAVRLEQPRDFQGRARIVAYLQHEGTKRIVAAASTIPAS